MGSHLDIDFSPIFFDFGSQNGAKLDGKSIKNVIQKGIQKQMRKSSRLGRLLAASWPPLGRILATALARRYLGAAPLQGAFL